MEVNLVQSHQRLNHKKRREEEKVRHQRRGRKMVEIRGDGEEINYSQGEEKWSEGKKKRGEGERKGKEEI